MARNKIYLKIIHLIDVIAFLIFIVGAMSYDGISTKTACVFMLPPIAWGFLRLHADN